MLAPPSDSVTLPDRIDPRITTDPHWTALAAPLDRASANGTDVPAILRAIASETLPTSRPARCPLVARCGWLSVVRASHATSESAADDASATLTDVVSASEL